MLTLGILAFFDNTAGAMHARSRGSRLDDPYGPGVKRLEIRNPAYSQPACRGELFESPSTRGAIPPPAYGLSNRPRFADQCAGEAIPNKNATARTTRQIPEWGHRLAGLVGNASETGSTSPCFSTAIR
jgi:hypothetical protein